MEDKMDIRTDLAMEIRESFPEDNVEIKGVILTEELLKEDQLKVTTVEIKDEQGAKAMQKPIGTYITLEAREMEEKDEDYHLAISKVLEGYLKKLVGNLYKKGVLIVGLGNREITSDALGPWVVDHLFITRHLIRELGEGFGEKNHLKTVSAIAPGVMAQTGMEVVEIVKGIIRETKPGVIIAIDALAARNVERLNKTIQISDTGISPGSGIGNNRMALNEESLETKVIALGVPTVVAAETIVRDSLEQMLVKQGFSEQEVTTFLQEVTEQNSIHNMFVTPKNIDESMKSISYTISEALNSCFCG